jgi:hypothetical protein
MPLMRQEGQVMSATPTRVIRRSAAFVGILAFLFGSRGPPREHPDDRIVGLNDKSIEGGSMKKWLAAV